MAAPQTYSRLALIGGAVVVVLVADSSGLFPPRAALIIDDSAQLAAGVFASVCCAVGSSWVRGAERTWRRLMAIAMAGWSVGQLLWSWYQIVDHQPLPSPSAADVGYLCLPVFAVPALLVIAADSRRRRPGRRPASVVPSWLVLVLDGLIVVGSMLILTWVSTLGAVVHAGGPSTMAFAVAVTYPLTDLLLVVMVILLLSTQPAPLRLRPQLVLLGLGLAGLAVSDSIFAYLVAGGAQEMPPISNAGFVAGPLLIGLAGLTVGRPAPGHPPKRELPSRATNERLAWANLLLPYLPLLLTGAVIVHQEVTGREQQPVEVYVGIPVVALVVIRQMLALIDNNILLRRVSTIQRRLRHQAYHDSLTGLANRNLFYAHVAQAIKTPAGRTRHFALYFLDLDNFKNINDEYGHAVGDRVLRVVAERLRASVRDIDVVARLGGDEFGVLVENEIGDPTSVGHRVLEAVRQPIAADSREVTVSVSVGAVLVSTAEPGLTADVILKHADDAMYAGKQRGKGVFVLHEPPSRSD
jgi:diguanylate cyclase (GGDEF)-like protein